MTGKFVDWSRDEYEADDTRMRSTRLKELLEDPEVFAGRYVTGELPPKETKRMGFGIALHSLVFDGVEEYVVFGGDKVKERKRWAEFKAEHQGTTILTPLEEQNLRRMAGRLRQHEVAAPLLFGDGFDEHTILWTHAPTGIECKARLDRLQYDGTVVDLKLVGDPSEDFFARQVINFRYDFSAGFYALARNAAMGKLIDAPHKFVCICDKPELGFPVRVWNLPDDALKIGISDVHMAMRDYKQRLDANDWRNDHAIVRPDGIVPEIELPGYYWKEHNPRT